MLLRGLIARKVIDDRRDDVLCVVKEYMNGRMGQKDLAECIDGFYDEVADALTTDDLKEIFDCLRAKNEDNK